MPDGEDRRSRESAVGPDERARESIEHLQAAACEVIAAARAMLDVAEEVVTDPASASAVLSGFASVVRMARQATDPTAGHGRAPGDVDWERGDEDPGVQHIPVV